MARVGLNVVCLFCFTLLCSNAVVLPNTRVVIVGGGIGGLATALSLRTIAGVENVEVYERAEEENWGKTGAGTGICVWPNGMNAAREIDPRLHKALLAEGTAASHTAFLMNGQRMARELAYQKDYGQPLLFIRWSSLRAILASLLPKDSIHLGRTIVGYSPNDKEDVAGEGVTAIFGGEGGKEERITTPLLIGTDGIRSNVRHLMLMKEAMGGSQEVRIEMGDKQQPQDEGRDLVRAVTRAGHSIEGCTEGSVMFPTSSAGGSACVMPVGEGSTYWAVACLDQNGALDDSKGGGKGDETATSATGHVKNGSRLGQLTRKEVKALLASQVAPVSADVASLIEKTNDEDIVIGRQIHMPLTPFYTHGRVVLAGDAAHSMVFTLGQGANTALEDAAQLALCLKHGSSVEEALAEYNELRTKRCWILQKRSMKGLPGRPKEDEGEEDSFKEMFKTDAEFTDWMYGYTLKHASGGKK